MHEMRLDEKWFNLIANGKKTVEGRINDEKRKLIKIGDQIKFINRNNNQEFVIKNVKNKKLFPNFDKALRYSKLKYTLPNSFKSYKEATEWYESFPGYKNKEVVMFYF